jgi:hypothetical protein
MRADYISLIQADKCETIIEIYIQEDSVRITFEIGPKDAQWFKHVIPVDYYEDGFTEEEALGSFQTFFKKSFPFMIDGKISLEGRIKKIEMRERIRRSSLYTGKVDTTAQLSKYIVFVEIVYPFLGKPQKISITPPIKAGYDVTFANIGFVAYHKMIPINDIRYLGSEETVNLNWEDPWYSYFDNKNIRRHHNSSLMSFLYIDPYEVRHEILVRVMDLENWLESGYNLDDYIEVADQETLKKAVADFLVGRNKVKIDDELVKPILDKIHFVEVQLSGIQILQVPKRLPYSSAIIGVIFIYPNPGIPQRVTIDWDMFSEQIQRVPNTATDPAGPMKYFISPDDNVLVWQNFLKKYKLPTISEVRVTNASLGIPIITLLLLVPSLFMAYKNRKEFKAWSNKTKLLLLILFIIAIVAVPIRFNFVIPFLKKEGFSKPEASNLINQLLKNTYRAFDFREEGDIYDKLAVSNDGELLAEIYLQTKKGMILENQGGIQVKVQDINILDVEEVQHRSDGLAYQCKWQVSGTVGHWGHIHRRTNQYYAILNVIPVDGIWKLYGLDIIEEVRL